MLRLRRVILGAGCHACRLGQACKMIYEHGPVNWSEIGRDLIAKGDSAPAEPVPYFTNLWTQANDPVMVMSRGGYLGHAGTS